MVAANREDVSTIGFADFTFSFNGKQFILPVIVANTNAKAVRSRFDAKILM